MREVKVLTIVVCLGLFIFSGCDLLNPSKKAVKSPKADVTKTAVPSALSVDKAEAKKPLPSGVIARVGDWTLTETEFTEKIKAVKEMVKDFNEKEPGAKAMLLNEIVRQQLLIQQAQKDGLQNTDEIRMAVKEFESTLLVQEIVMRYTKDVVMTEADAKKYYETNGEEFQKPVEKQLREIVVATETEAKDILVQVLQGGDFAQIAKEKSKGAAKDNGGDLGFKTEASFPAMAVAVSTLNKGGVSSVFQGPDGFYIVKVEDIRGGDKVPYEEVKEDLLKFLKLRQQQQILVDKVKEIEEKIKVQVNEDLIKGGTGE
jgi:peptidyl-prolyl cis-trans isomerase C